MTSPGIGVGVSLHVDVRDVQRVLEQLHHNLSFGQLEAFLRTQAVPFLQQRAAARFAGEGDEVSGRWSPLQLSTLLTRAQHGFPTAPINVRTNQMKSFVTGSFGDVVGAGGISVLTWPSQANYGGALAMKIQTAQAGRTSPPTVARPVIGVGEKDNIFITAALTAHLMSGIGSRIIP